MPTTPTNVYSGKRIQPIYRPELAIEMAVNLPANVNYPRGTILGELTGTYGTYKAYSSTLLASPSAAPTLSASGTGSQFAGALYFVAYSYTNSVGETTLSPTASITPTAGQNIVVAAITLPTGATGLRFYVSEAGGSSNDLRFVAAQTGGAQATLTGPPAAGAPLPLSTATATAATDGSQNAQVILIYDCATDAAGNVTLSPTAGQVGGEWGTTTKTAPVYFTGVFSTSDLNQTAPGALDNAALTKNGSRWGLIEGTLTSGIIALGT